MDGSRLREPAYRKHGKFEEAEDGPGSGNRFLGRVSGKLESLNESRLESAGFLGDPGTDALARVTLDARALLLTIDAIGRLNGGDGEAKRRRETERDSAEPEVTEWKSRFLHSPYYMRPNESVITKGT